MIRDLFQELQTQTGCSYISDLRYSPHLEKARRIILSLDLEKYPVSVLEDAASYLYSEYPDFKDVGEARMFFLKKQKTEK